jgi:hypothetical protein
VGPEEPHCCETNGVNGRGLVNHTAGRREGARKGHVDWVDRWIRGCWGTGSCQPSSATPLCPSHSGGGGARQEGQAHCSEGPIAFPSVKMQNASCLHC